MIKKGVKPVFVDDILSAMELTSIYLHIPFCKQRCTYCDFNTYAGMENFIPSYMHALCREAEFVAKTLAEKIPVHTIFFGGGTPSILSAAALEHILTVIHDGFQLQPEVEISLEANPGTLSLEYLRSIKSLGINRLSIGMQSAHRFELNLMGRIHLFDDVIRGVEWARQAGYKNINLDLIYGLPHQTIDDWKRSLEFAMKLQPEHFSLYALTLEDGTPMASWVNRGLLAGQDPDLAADMYELAESMLEEAGYQSYEISNWAASDQNGNLLSCRHNLQYWRGKPYLGMGAGAHGYAEHTRTANVLLPSTYIERIRQACEPGRWNFPITPATEHITHVNLDDEMGETMMMGLRLTQEGVIDIDFSRRFGQTLEQRYGPKIKRLLHLGLLEWVDNPERCLRLTKRGRLLGNQVFGEFI